MSELAHDDSVVEYGSITAALAILVTSLSGVLSSVGTLPASDLKATALVSAAARSQHVSGPEARAAYAKAPYRRPVLRYLYAVGWVGAAKDRAKCRAALLLGPKPSDAVAEALRRTPEAARAAPCGSRHRQPGGDGGRSWHLRTAAPRAAAVARQETVPATVGRPL